MRMSNKLAVGVIGSIKRAWRARRFSSASECPRMQSHCALDFATRGLRRRVRSGRRSEAMNGALDRRAAYCEDSGFDWGRAPHHRATSSSGRFLTLRCGLRLHTLSTFPGLSNALGSCLRLATSTNLLAKTASLCAAR